MSTPYQYPTDITDARWQQLRRLLPARRWRRGGPGRPPRDLRLVLRSCLKTPVGRPQGSSSGLRIERFS